MFFLSNPFKTNGIFHKATMIKGRMVHGMYRGDTGYNFQKKILHFSKDRFCFSKLNSAEPDEMLHYGHNAAFHLGLHCLPNRTFSIWEKAPGQYWKKVVDLT